MVSSPTRFLQEACTLPAPISRDRSYAQISGVSEAPMTQAMPDLAELDVLGCCLHR